jgi:hypothetical protein
MEAFLMSASNSDFLKTSHGTYQMAVVTRENVRTQDSTVITAVACWAKEAKKPPGKRRVCCDADFVKGAKPAALLVLTPFIPMTAAVISGLCARCHATGDIRVKALLAWRTILPDLTEVEGGRA